MATLKSKKLQEALKRAKNVGRAEEPVTIDGCSLVLQSLAPSAYEDALREVADLDGAEYLHGFQIGHVCRSIVEIEGVDLREVEFVEDDVPVGSFLVNAVVSKSQATAAKEAMKAIGIDLVVVPPDGSEGERTVTVERAEWLRQRISTWSREAIAVAWKKFADVVVEGERRSKDKITFRTPDEADEDKFRRLLSEAKELEAELPPDLVKKALDDIGYLPKSTPEELEGIAKRAREFAEEQARKKAETPQPEPELEPELDQADLRSKLEERAAAESAAMTEDLANRMRNRVPLNQASIQAPVPMAPAQRPVQVPQQLQQAMAPRTPESRSAQIAALEAQLDPSLVAEGAVPQPPQEIAELSKSIQGVDGKGLAGIIERPPVAGINPRFRQRQ